MDGIIDTEPEENTKSAGTILLGDGGYYGENYPDSMRNITVSNVICNNRNAIYVGGFLTDSVINNVISTNPGCEAVKVTRENGLKNVAISNTVVKKNN